MSNQNNSNTPAANEPPPKRPSFLLTLLILLACLSLGGAIGMALAYLAHLLQLGENIEALIMLAGILGIGVSLFNFLSRRFPKKIGFSR
jgi:hypothetical protein